MNTGILTGSDPDFSQCGDSAEEPILGWTEAEALKVAPLVTADKQRLRLRLVLLGFAARILAAADPAITTATQAARVLAEDLATPEAFTGSYRRVLDAVRALSRPGSRLGFHTLRFLLRQLEKTESST